MTSDGVVDGFAYWFHLRLEAEKSEHTTISTDADRPDNSWDQAILFSSKMVHSFGSEGRSSISNVRDAAHALGSNHHENDHGHEHENGERWEGTDDNIDGENEDEDGVMRVFAGQELVARCSYSNSLLDISLCSTHDPPSTSASVCVCVAVSDSGAGKNVCEEDSTSGSYTVNINDNNNNNNNNSHYGIDLHTSSPTHPFPILTTIPTTVSDAVSSISIIPSRHPLVSHVQLSGKDDEKEKEKEKEEDGPEDHDEECSSDSDSPEEDYFPECPSIQLGEMDLAMLNDGDRSAAFLCALSSALRNFERNRQDKEVEKEVEIRGGKGIIDAHERIEVCESAVEVHERVSVSVLELTAGWSSVATEGILKNILCHTERSPQSIRRSELHINESSEGGDSDREGDRERGGVMIEDEVVFEGERELLRPYGHIQRVYVCSPFGADNPLASTSSTTLLRHSINRISHALDNLQMHENSCINVDVDVHIDVDRRAVDMCGIPLEHDNLSSSPSDANQVNDASGGREHVHDDDDDGMDFTGRERAGSPHQSHPSPSSAPSSSMRTHENTKGMININKNIQIELLTGNIIDAYLDKNHALNKGLCSGAFQIIMSDILEGSGLLRQNSLQELKFALDFLTENSTDGNAQVRQDIVDQSVN